MNHSNLKTVIDAEPANAARTDAEVLDWFKDAVDVYSNVIWERFALWASRYNGIIKFETAKSSGSTDDVKRAASIGLLILEAGKDLSLSVAEIRALMGNLVPAVFTVAEKDDLLDFSKSNVERWIDEGFRRMGDKSRLYHINVARAL